jgi:predicted transcriptional regulator
MQTSRIETQYSPNSGSLLSAHGDDAVPQIWMTYGEIAALLGCTPDEVRVQAVHRSLDRKKSRDGFTRVKLDSEWTASFFAAIRNADPMLNQAISKLRTIHGEMARGNREFVNPETAGHQIELAARSSL